MTSEDTENLKALVRTAAVRMITIDSSIFNRHGLALDRGLLSQLSQFRKSRFKLVLSEIVVREVRRQITAAIESDMAVWPKLRKRLKALPHTVDEASELDEALASVVPSTIAWHQTDQFLIATNADVASAEHAKLADVLDLYFEYRPPFDKGGKRCEFPDAIALLGLEAWCQAGKSGMIVVTEDQDWVRYCATSSENLVVVKDLATALEIINASEEERQARAADRQERLMRQMDSGQLVAEMRRQLEQRLLDQTRAVGSSSFAYEAEIVRVDVGEITLSDPGRIRDDDMGFVLLLSVNSNCMFWANFEFHARTAAQTPGRGVHGFGQNVEALALVTAQGDEISIEVILHKDGLVVDFGEVEPDTDDVTPHVSRHS